MPDTTGQTADTTTTNQQTEQTSASTQTDAGAAQQGNAAGGQQSGGQQTTTTATSTTETDAAGSQDNQANAWRRKAEAAEAKLKEAETEREALKNAKLTEEERAAKAEREAAEAKRDLLRIRVAQEAGLPADAVEFLTGDDADALKASAEKLKALGIGKAAPVSAGTTTNPQANQQPSIDERIAAAEKAGDRYAAIALKREKAGLPL